GRVRPFNILADHARWIDSAVVYQVFPRIFVENGRLTNVTQKLPELASLGVNTIYLQPVFSTYYGGMGYDVMDYFTVRSDYGSLQDLRTLVQTAHALGMRVLLDFVPNHASIYHPYAQDAIANGPASHYYDFFQRSITTPPVLGTMYTKTVGKMSFVYYFTWSTMPNLNFDNAELCRMITEAGKYWIEQCDVDGYRADAVWALNERAPAFMKEWRLALKRVKPDVLLLAEDRAASPAVFDQRFDAAYDWAPDPSWVSHWYWQTSYASDYRQSKTIFNDAATPDRTRLLGIALTNNGNGYPRMNRVLRFMQNNDLPGFLATHDLPTTKMAAALLFSLHGIPMMFNGEEIGNLTHPYDAFMLFQAGKSIRSLDTRGLYDYYAQLISMRKSHPALSSPDMMPIGVYPTNLGLYAFRRWAGTQNVFTIINSGYNTTTARINIPVDSLALVPGKTYYLTDLLTGESFSRPAETFMTMFIPMNGVTTRLLYLDTVTVTGIKSPLAAGEVPLELSLEQNYPNPFNPTTTIAFELPARSAVRLAVFDLLGREVAALVNGTLESGRHTAQFNAGPLASGVYFYRLEVGKASFVRKMLVMK
ncbi:MAG TPA: alpha-amylase family glycosyl hydrolase, partial [Bacteroidota bacterium]